jgi:predicted methyltransferase
MRMIIAAALAATVLAGCSGAEEAPAPENTYAASHYAAAVNDIARPQADRDRDASRKPGDLLAFAQIDRGETVGDYIMGGGYVTRLLAMAVGPSGKVYAFQPTEFIGFRPAYATEQDETVKAYSDEQGNPTNVFPLRASISDPGFPAGELDTIITVMNLHDLFIGPMAEGTGEKAIAALYAALKPGGTLVVVDHKAAEGAGLEAADTVHRMDEQVAKDMLTAAGFVLDEESDMYANPEDAHDKNVFDPEIMGQTDQFALRFHKPE